MGTPGTGGAAGATSGGSGGGAASGGSGAPITGGKLPYHWGNVVIGGGGFVPGIVFHPTVKGLAYARTDMGGAYRWEGVSKRWTPITEFFTRYEETGIESIGLDPNDGDRVYVAAGTSSGDEAWVPACTLLSSTDRGDSWTSITLPFKCGGNEDGRSMGERLAVDPNQGGTLFMGTRRSGLWKSADHGATWDQVGTFPVTGATANGVGVGFVVFDPSGGTTAEGATKTLYAGLAQAPNGLYRSTDAGATWNAVPGQPTAMMPHHAVLGKANTLFLTYVDGPGPNGITSGAVWKLNLGTDQWSDISPIENATFGYAGLAVDPQHPDTVMVGSMDRWWPGDDIWRTTNGGTSWKAVKDDSTRDATANPWLVWGSADLLSAGMGNWIGTIAIDPFDADHVMYATGATVWGSENITQLDAAGGKATFTPHVAGLEENAVLDLASPPSGPMLLSGIGDLGGFVHEDVTIAPAMPNPHFTNGTSIDFAESDPQVIARAGGSCDAELASCASITTDGGTTWTTFAPTPDGGNARGQLAVSADGKTILWSPMEHATHRSVDGGQSWTAVTGLAGTGIDVVADRADASRFYAIVDGTVYRSSDGGASFQAGATGLSGDQLRAVPGLAQNVWLSGGNGLFRSTDGGATFEPVAGPTETASHGFGKAAPGETHPAVFVSGTVDGVQGIFRSDDGGATWIRANDDQHTWGGLGGALIGDPRIYGRFYLATNGRGIIVGDGSP